MASSRGSTASSKPPKQRLAVTAQSATSKPWFTCSQPNSISCFQTEIVATHAKQRRTHKSICHRGGKAVKVYSRGCSHCKQQHTDCSSQAPKSGWSSVLRECSARILAGRHWTPT